MIMMGIEFTGTIPFSDVYVHSIIQAPDGRRMSKSLGTGIDPLDLINGGLRPPVFGDGSRPPGEFPAVWGGRGALGPAGDVLGTGRALQRGGDRPGPAPDEQALERLAPDPDARRRVARVPPLAPTTVEDRWILSRLERARARLDQAIDGYELSRAAFELYDFIYGELCDWYLELVKPRLYDGDEATAATLLHLLTETITMAHPVIPFVTEEIYSYIPGAEGLLAARVSAQADAAPPSTRRPRWRSTARSRPSPRSGRGGTPPGSPRGRRSARG